MSTSNPAASPSSANVPSSALRRNGLASSSNTPSSIRGGTDPLLSRIFSFLRILLSPLRRFLLMVLPSTGHEEYDGLSPAVTAKATQHFCDYLRNLAQSISSAGHGPSVAIGSSSGGPNSGNSAVSSSGSGDTNGNDGSLPASPDTLWLNTGFVAAQEQATQQSSLLLLYLHSPLHRSSENFCRHVLLGNALTEFLRQPHVLGFGVSIHTAQGAYLAQMLQTSCYPFLALLQPRMPPPSAQSTSSRNSSSSQASQPMSLVLRAEGPILMDPQVQQSILPQQLLGALHRHHMVVAELEARRLQRQEESDLRRQQDEEYQASLRADQERERLAREEAERERQRLEEEKREKEILEEAAKAALQEAKDRVPEEPSSGGTVIRFVLPSGTKLNRRFFSSESIGGLKAFLTVHFHDNNIPMENFALSTSFPKKTYEDETVTLEQAGLCPQAVLMVQDLDS